MILLIYRYWKELRTTTCFPTRMKIPHLIIYLCQWYDKVATVATENRSATILPHEGSTATLLCVCVHPSECSRACARVFSSRSVCHHHQHQSCRRLSQRMTHQSNLPVFEPKTHSHTHTHYFFFLQRDVIYKIPLGSTMFVCLHLWLLFGSPNSLTLPLIFIFFPFRYIKSGSRFRLG